jgi:hypothetical protein
MKHFDTDIMSEVEGAGKRSDSVPGNRNEGTENGYPTTLKRETVCLP